jgi:hypothetical protein
MVPQNEITWCYFNAFKNKSSNNIYINLKHIIKVLNNFCVNLYCVDIER